MRAVELDGSGQWSGLRSQDRPDPVAGPGEVLVSMRAASLNYRDLMIIDGRYRVQGKDGMVPLSDGAGEVVAVGPGVTRFAAGTRVMSVFFPRWHGGRPTASVLADQPGSTRDGVLAELVVFPEAGLVPIPDQLSYEEAATLPCAGVTSWAALQGLLPVAPGHRVLALGSGGVSMFALQFAKLAGAEVIVTTSSEEKAVRLKAYGADHIVNYRAQPDWHRAVRQIAPEGVDHVIENGGIGSLSRSIRACATGGVINLIGVLSEPEDFDHTPLIWSICDIRRVTVGSTADVLAMLRAIDYAKLRPVLDQVFELNQTAEAFEHFAAQRHIGKVVIRIS
jgi:NADPH:quinone reductase-like Zn-dependent oxidoreductase